MRIPHKKTIFYKPFKKSHAIMITKLENTLLTKLMLRFQLAFVKCSVGMEDVYEKGNKNAGL